MLSAEMHAEARDLLQEDLAAAAIQGGNQASPTGVARPWPGFHFRTRGVCA
jgi:hypothetical protein